MKSLEAELDREVNTYLSMVKQMPEVAKLLSGDIPKETYSRFLKTFYIIEHLSQKAVNAASLKTADENPYLSKRFELCAKGELGHAEIALEDLRNMGYETEDMGQLDIVMEYETTLMKHAKEFPLSILGHSYLFENVSAKMFPEHKGLEYPSRFVEVHAKEDPGHSLAIKRTVRNIEKGIGEQDIQKVIEFTRKSGDYLMEVFRRVN